MNWQLKTKATKTEFGNASWLLLKTQGRNLNPKLSAVI